MEQVFQPVPTGSSYLIAYITGAVKGLDVQRYVGAFGLDDLHSSPFGGLRPSRRQLRIPGVFLAAGSRWSLRLSGGLNDETRASVAPVQPLTLWK